MDERRLLRRINRGAVTNVAFADLCSLAEALGFELRRISGSHHHFVHPAMGKYLNLQPNAWAGKDLSGSSVRKARRALRSQVGGLTLSDYHINVFYSDEDECWVADIPDLEMCSAFGATAGEAVAEVEQAKQGLLEVAREGGLPIPEPRYRPAIHAS